MRITHCMFVLWLALAICSNSHCTRKPPAAHVIFISLDTTRPDHLGCYGNTWIRTPHLDRLAAESIRFANYMTVVPTTLPSHTSLFTGTYPHTHGNPQNGYVVNPKNVLLTEILKDAGFQTVGFIGSFALDSRFLFSQGFDYYNEAYEHFVGEGRLTEHERPAQSVTQSVIGYCNALPINQPLFLFVHYFDPHKPFAPPPPYDTMYTWAGEGTAGPGERIPAHYTCPHTLSQENWELSKEAALHYAGEISYMDHHLGILLQYLRQSGILDHSLLVVTSDHGENFWEHMPYFHHGTSTHQTSMQAVCMIRLPGGRNGGTTVVKPVSSIDVLPTVLNYLNLPLPEAIDGVAFDLHDVSGTIGERIIYGQATLTKPWKVPEVSQGWQHANKSRCIRRGNITYIQTPFTMSEELYDLARDPYEQNNLLVSPSPEVLSVAKELREMLEQWAASADPLESYLERDNRQETIEKLKALGYM